MESIMCFCANVLYRIVIHGGKCFAICDKCGASVEISPKGIDKHFKAMDSIVEKELDLHIEDEEEEDVITRSVA